MWFLFILTLTLFLFVLHGILSTLSILKEDIYDIFFWNYGPIFWKEKSSLFWGKKFGMLFRWMVKGRTFGACFGKELGSHYGGFWVFFGGISRVEIRKVKHFLEGVITTFWRRMGGSNNKNLEDNLSIGLWGEVYILFKNNSQGQLGKIKPTHSPLWEGLHKSSYRRHSPWRSTDTQQPEKEDNRSWDFLRESITHYKKGLLLHANSSFFTATLTNTIRIIRYSS